MNIDLDFIESEGPLVQSSLLLEFLIERFNEMLASENPEIPVLLQEIGRVGLDGDEELIDYYTGILSSPHHAPKAIIQRAVDLFEAALQRDPDNRPMRYSKQREEQEPDERVCKHFRMTAFREGRKMSRERDFRYVKVFEMLAWIGLQTNHEGLAAFEQVRRSHADDPGKLLEAGRDILRYTLFRSRPTVQECVESE